MSQCGQGCFLSEPHPVQAFLFFFPVIRVLSNCSSSTVQGMAFTLEERLQLGIHGLLPPCFLSQDVQVLRVMKSYETRADPLDK